MAGRATRVEKGQKGQNDKRAKDRSAKSEQNNEKEKEKEKEK